MPPRNQKFIDWKISEAKQIILNDLRHGELSLDPAVMPAELAWEKYRHLPEFEKVVFEQFKVRLAGHREQVGARVTRAMFDGAAVAHDQLNHPFPTHNHRGEPNFHLSPAEQLLRDDLRHERHLGLTPSQFQQTRDEYKIFKPRKFKELVSQTIRHIKFQNFVHERRTELPFDYQPW